MNRWPLKLYFSNKSTEPIGRFITEDSFPGETTNPQSQNLYLYVVNNPLSYIDPTGNFIQESSHQRRPDDDPYPNSSPGNKTNSSGKKNKPSFNLNVKPNFNPLLDLNGDYSFENDWDMVIGADVRITVEQMLNNTDIEICNDGSLSYHFKDTITSYTQYYGYAKIENSLEVDITLNPSANWTFGNNNSLTFEQNNKKFSIKEGELTVGGKNVGIIMDDPMVYNSKLMKTYLESEIFSNDYYKVEVSSQYLVTAEGLPLMNEGKFLINGIQGYYPIQKHEFKISDKLGNFSVSNDITVSVSRNSRDLAYGVVGGYAFGWDKIRYMISEMFRNSGELD